MEAEKSNTLLITGANRGIGLEYVKQYAEAGWTVLATCRTVPNALELLKLAQQHSNMQVVELDVANFSQIDTLAEQMAGTSIDLLINNAGVYPSSSFNHIDYDAWYQAFITNTMSTAKLAEAFAPNLSKAGNAKLVAMTSKMGSIDDNGSGGSYAYRSTKTALNMVVKSLSVDLAPSDISVVVLHPGWVRTDMGGPNGLIDVTTSVAGLRKVIGGLSLAQTGQFFAYDGKKIPW